MRVIICGAVLALTISTANAAEDLSSANYLLRDCKVSIEHPNPTFAQGYCMGIVQGLTFMARSSETWTCVETPAGVSNAQLVRVVVRYIEARPSRMHERFSALALEALLDAWPCKK